MFSFLRKEGEDTEIFRADVLYFLRSNFKFFGLLALVLSIIAVAAVSLIPKQYQKQVNLSVQQAPILRSGQAVEVEKLPPDTLGNAAVRYVQKEDLGDVSVSPKYDTVEQQVQLILSSRDPESLDSISSEVVDRLKTRFGEYFEDPLSRALEGGIAKQKLSNDQNREVLTQIGQPSTEAFELQRAQVLTQIAKSEAEIRDLEQAQSDLSRVAPEIVSVEIRNESEVHQASSSARQIALAVLAALVVAAILTIVRGALWKKPRA